MTSWLLSVQRYNRNPSTLEWYWALDPTIAAAWQAKYVVQMVRTTTSAYPEGTWRLTKRGLRRLQQLAVLAKLRGVT